ncbi:MAG: surface antigen [Bacteroidetes bacterium]|nr:surface antigen [Bacteroidota bacterium]
MQNNTQVFNMKRISYLLFIFIVFLTVACNSTKHVTEGNYLLDKSQIHTEIKDIPKSELENYLRQTPNAKVLGLFRMQLAIYNLAGNDTASRWNKWVKRIGDAPVIYDENLTRMSALQLQKLFINKGYINAKVDTKVKTKKKKAVVDYYIHSNKPYNVRNYSIAMSDSILTEVASDTSKSLIHPGMLFDVDVLDAERLRITSHLRQQGYYNFIKDFLVYTADSSLNSRKVDVKLDLRTYLKTGPDSINDLVFKKFKIHKVVYYFNTDAQVITNPENTSLDNAEKFRDFYLINTGEKFISLDALVHNTYINPGNIYSDTDVEKTYSALNSMGPVKYVNITFKETADNQLDCYISLVPAKTISVSSELEGTYTDGYWGGAAKLSGVNKNAFKGAETLTLQGRLAYEWQQGIWAQEIGAQVGLRFPKFLAPFGSYNIKRNLHANTEFTADYNYTDRPYEFRASNIAAGMNYIWNRQKYRHSLEFFNLSFMDFRILPEFEEKYLSTGEYNRYNYESRFILRMGYSGSFSNYNSNRPLRNYSTHRYSIESAGNFLNGLNELLGSQKSSDGYYKLFNVRYSQYVRGEYNMTHYQIFDKSNRFVYHFGAGLGVPYGNANIIPYERRFYAGGANSVRGWAESTLGPGTYLRNPNVRSRDYNQVGDIKLDMNMEYRAKMFWLLEGALFLDAGNIWTIKDYENQSGGVFRLDSFAEQFAIAYGAGLRFDFSFFIFRFDMGVRLYDPVLSRLERWRLGINWSEFKEATAFHIAIGYPF